eukprot:SAG31_NODE_12_length_38498_cov_21.161671_35_plen_153_part_00
MLFTNRAQRTHAAAKGVSIDEFKLDMPRMEQRSDIEARAASFCESIKLAARACKEHLEQQRCTSETEENSRIPDVPDRTVDKVLPVLIVSHGGWIQSFLAVVTGEEPPSMVRNCSITRLDFILDRNAETFETQVIEVNGLSHLGGSLSKSAW